MSTEERPEPAAPGRIALRSPLEAFLWIFITRLIALLTATRLPGTSDDRSDRAPSAGATGGADPARAKRVAASRAPVDAELTSGSAAATGAPTPATDTTARTVAVTAAATVVAGAAAFAAGRRRGRR